VEPKPVREIVRVTEDGHPMAKPCQHALDQADCVLPGLDADYCTVCRVYWVDQSIQNEAADRLDEIEGLPHHN
jgi:hypothetical protein